MTRDELICLCQTNPLVREAVGVKTPEELAAITADERDAYYGALGERMEALLTEKVENQRANLPNYTDFPEALRRLMRFTCQAHNSATSSMRWDCEFAEPMVGGALYCRNVIMDTSEYARDPNGKPILVKSQFTHLDDFLLGGTYAWFVRKLRPEEK